MAMTFRILGCDGSFPGALGACSGYLVEASGDLLQLDLGCATLPRLMALARPETLAALLLTHWHHDHAGDLLALKYYLQINKKQMLLYSPRLPRAWESLLEGGEFVFKDLAGLDGIAGFSIRTQPVDHPFPTLALRIERGGKSLVYTGDAVGSPGLAGFCRGANLLVCDATFNDAQWHPGLPHFSASQAARVAADAGVGQLVLTHTQPGSDRQTLLAEAKAVFPNSILAEPSLAITL